MDIGKRLRHLRIKNGLSQRQLADRAGLTNGTVSLIEKNKISPSIASLNRLLDAIPVSMAQFFSAVEPLGTPRYVFRAAEFENASVTPWTAVARNELGKSRQDTLQMLRVTYPPGTDSGAKPRPLKVETCGVVLSGSIELTAGDQHHLLGEGDGYFLESGTAHRFVNSGAADCIIFSANAPAS